MSCGLRLQIAACGAFLFCAAWPGLGHEVRAAIPSPELAGIVSVHVTAQAYDPVVPWIKTADQALQGNALVVEGKKLLTTADMIKNATLIEVRKFGRYPDFPAKVARVDYEANLALLDVETPEFWEGLKPLPLGEVSAIKNQFTISRWRSNSRFEQGSGELVDYLVAPYRFGSMELPTLRGTTSMSALGWAEVATADQRVVALITSHESQQIEATPSTVLRFFLMAARTSRGFAQRGFTWQRTNNPALRRKLDLPESGLGVLVRGILAGGTGAGLLQPGDILMRIGPYEIDPEGQIDHPQYGRVTFTLALNETLDDTVPVEIQRGGKLKRLDLPRRLFTPADYRVAPYSFDQRPDFEVQGGLVMQELSVNFLRAWGKPWPERAPTRLAIEAVENSVRDKDQPPGRLITVTRILPDESNLGYEDVQNAIVRAVNGRPLHSLADLRESLKHPVEGFQVFEILPSQGRSRVVFKATALEAINRRIRQRYNIPGDLPASGVAAALPASQAQRPLAMDSRLHR